MGKLILFLPDRFTDFRLWSDIPTRIGARAEVIHFDQHGEMPWAGLTAEFIETARGLARGGEFDVVVAAGQADHLGLALAEAGLAKGLALFHPPIPADIPARFRPDWSDPAVRQSVDEAAESMAPLAEALAADLNPATMRDAFLASIHDEGQDLEPAVLELAMSMYGDHAGEMFAWLEASVAASEEEEGARQESAEPQAWPGYLASLTVPVVLVVPPRGRALAVAWAEHAQGAEVAAIRPGAGLAPTEDRARAAEVILHLLDRVG